MIGIKTVKKDGQARNGFVWPRKGKVTAPDWNDKPECGGGLHFLAAGDNSPGIWHDDGRWLVIDTGKSPVVDLGGKRKCKSCKVLHYGTRESAMKYLADHSYGGPWYRALYAGGDGATVSGGDWATVSGGVMATVSGGDWATVSGGNEAMVSGGDRATVSGGDRATVSGGDQATVSGGYGAILTLKWHDGNRYRITTAYVGEGGIKANTFYRINNGKFEEVPK